MSYLLTPRRMMLSQAFIILYSILAAILGRSWQTFLIIIVLVVLTSIIQARRSKGPLGLKARPEEIEAGKVLYREEGVRELQMSDEGLARDIEAQSKALMTLNLALMAGIIYFILFWRFLDPLYNFIYNNFISDERIAHFLSFLAYLEGYFIVSTASMLYASKRIGPMPMINMPSSYVVTEKGLVYKGLITSTAIPFPLPPDVEVRADEKRKFVELVKRDKRSLTIIRLYSRNPRRLYNVIRRYGLRAGGEGEAGRREEG